MRHTIFVIALAACAAGKPGVVAPRATAVATQAVTATVTKLHDFTFAEGFRVRDSFTAGPDGALYETAWQGGTGTWQCSTADKPKTCSCGTVQRFDPSTNAVTVIHDYSALDATGRNLDGCNSVAPVSVHAGRLWVVSQAGGTGGNPIRPGLGSIQSMLPDGSDFRREYDFGGMYPRPYTDGGGGSQGGLVWDEAAGVAYGVNSAGIYVFDPVAHTVVIKYGFSPRASDGTNATGSNPYGTPVLTPWRTLIGATYYGGAYGRGVLYEVDPTIWVERVIYSFPAYTFTGNTDNTPVSSPIIGSDGAVYYAVAYGGGGPGMLIKVERTATVLHEYSGYPYSADGAIPLGTLLEGDDGKLWEPTMYGVAGYGTIGRVEKDGRQFEVVYTFMLTPSGGPTSMCYPYAGLAKISGRVFGTTGLCGTGYGTLFEVQE